MTLSDHVQAIGELHRAGAFSLLGNLLSYSICKLIWHTQRARELRACATEHSRLERVERAHICDGCGARGASEHAWFCPGGAGLFNYHDMNAHIGLRKSP